MKAIYTTIENIDTDQIIPARFLKRTSREGFGEAMFHDWRFDGQKKPIDSSIFAPFENSSPGERPSILVAGKNFGCGSSREHAAWALADYGFKAVVSSFFADIFRNNALNNKLLPIQISESFLHKIFAALQKNPDSEIDIDLKERCISIGGKGKETGEEGVDWEYFPIGEYKQHCLLNGLMDIDFLVSTKGQIETFENNRQ